MPGEKRCCCHCRSETASLYQEIEAKRMMSLISLACRNLPSNLEALYDGIEIDSLNEKLLSPALYPTTRAMMGCAMNLLGNTAYN